jgi:preprotein translocase subunit SecB
MRILFLCVVMKVPFICNKDERFDFFCEVEKLGIFSASNFRLINGNYFFLILFITFLHTQYYL